MNTLCAECGTELIPIKNEVSVVEMLGKPPRATKIWSADLWGCPKCEIKVVKDFGLAPIAVRGVDEDFYEILSKSQASEMVVYNVG